MKVSEFRKLESRMDQMIREVSECHLEDLQGAVADALSEIAECIGELEDALDLEDD